jgi:hypothetical protein
MKEKTPVQLPHLVAFRLDDAGKTALDAVANACGIKPAAFARLKVLEAAGLAASAPPIRRRVMHAEELRLLLAELGRQGSNLNQLARHVNMGGRAAELSAVVEMLREEHARALAAVTRLLVGAAE